MPAATHSEQIAGSPETCFAAIADMERYPEWQSAVSTVAVVSRDGDHRPEVVRFEVDLHVRQVTYTLRYAYEHPRAVTWSYVEGDVADISGGYTFEALAGGKTHATYALDIDFGFPVPGLLAKRIALTAMRRSVNELKQRVETDAAR